MEIAENLSHETHGTTCDSQDLEADLRRRFLNIKGGQHCDRKADYVFNRKRACLPRSAQAETQQLSVSFISRHPAESVELLDSDANDSSCRSQSSSISCLVASSISRGLYLPR